MNRLRLTYAAEVFLAEARRQFARLNPGQDCPIKRLNDYPPDQRSALMAAIEKANLALDPKSDQAFLQWSLSQQQENQ